MCGIAGHHGPRVIRKAAIDCCLRQMHHRGPDHADARTWRREDGGQTSVLCTRLSIIDLDPRANQPMEHAGKWLVYNGELYNYRELREQLRAAGHRFRTTSDSEVVLRALDTWDLGALDRFEGMWAFALYDERTGTLTLARDRFGEKPLYLLRDDADLYFASEIKCLAALAGRKLSVNMGQVTRYLMNGYKSLYKSGQTFFADVTELAPGTTIRVTPDGHGDVQRYWTPCFAPDADMSFDEAVAGTRERLIRAVGLRLRADVPLAFCMSGGVDSNAIISIARRVFDYEVHGFTVATTDRRYDEMALVTRAVGELKIRHTRVALTTTEFLPSMRQLVRAHDGPVFTISYYAHWLLQKAVAERDYRVSVSGTGADELFSGYYDHHLQYLAGLRDEATMLAEARDAWTRHVKPLVRNPFLHQWDRFVQNPGFRDYVFVDGPRFDALFRDEWREEFTETTFTDDLLRNRMMNEMFYESVPVMLHEDDLNAMYFSIENRSPFLDRALFEFSYRIPSRHLIRNARAKAVLREAMRDLVPAPILDSRRKVGFNAPVSSFLDLNDSETRSWLLSDGPIYDVLDRSGIKALIAKPSLKNHESKFMFYVLSAKLFLEEFAA